MTDLSALDGLGSIAEIFLAPGNSQTPIFFDFAPQLRFSKFLLKLKEFPDDSFANASGI